MELSSNKDIEFMSVALEEAKTAKTGGDLPFGSVVVCDGQIIGRGHATTITTKNPIAHAELLAIQEACSRFDTKIIKQSTIYCTNEPCIMCTAGIIQAGITKIIIGASRNDLPNFFKPKKINIDTIIEDSQLPIEIIRGVSKDEVVSLFSDIKKDK